MSLFADITGYFGKQSKPFLITSNILILLVIGFIDYITGYQISVSLLYLIPVSFAAWLGGKKPGLFISVLSIVTIAATDFMAGKDFPHDFVVLWNLLMDLGFFVVYALVLSSLSDAYRREKESARRDFLTGIANRQSFVELAEREIERAKRYRTKLTLVYIDCDNFKVLNDTLGHQTGDKALRHIASIIDKNTRATDISARLGGDEFVILFTDARTDGSELAIRNIRSLLLEDMEKNNWDVKFSIGMVTFVTPPHSVEAMIKKADMMMYDVKKSTQNAIKYEVLQD